MNAPDKPAARPASTSGPVRRIAASMIMGGLIVLVLWVFAFSFVTSLLVGAGCCVVVVAASTVSDVVEMVLDAITTIVLGAFAAIAAVVAAVFGLFGS
jgi:hypothetical protein